MPMTAGALAELLEGDLVGDAQANIRGVGSLTGAKPGDLVYAEAEKDLPAALASPASAVLVGSGVFVRGKTIIRVAHPKWAFARAAAALLPEPASASGRHPTAIVHTTARIDPSVALGPYVVVEENARVGANCQIGAGCYVGANATIGDDCLLFAHVTIYRNVRLGDRVRIHSGTVIGADGFGYVHVGDHYEKFPQRGTVVIEDDVEIGANSAIDRGALDETWIGRGTKLDNMVHVGHNVQIGWNCVIAAQTGISGSVTIGDHVLMGGQVGIADHCRIEDEAVLGAQTGVPSHKTIRRGQTVWGTPSRPLADFKKSYPYVARLPDLATRVAALEKSKRRTKKRN